MTLKLLIAEDARDIAEVVAYSARVVWPDANVSIAANGHDAIRAIAAEPPDLVVLDVNMPGPDGFAVCQQIRQTSRVPILMLTIRGATIDKVRGFDLGADDYLTKPFDPLELQARMRALLRRVTPSSSELGSPESITIGDLTIDVPAHEARLSGEHLLLTPLEFRLLTELARYPGRALSHEQLRVAIWGPDRVGHPSDVKVFIRRLRQKLGDDAEQPRCIETVRGVGYRFAVPD